MFPYNCTGLEARKANKVFFTAKTNACSFLYFKFFILKSQVLAFHSSSLLFVSPAISGAEVTDDDNFLQLLQGVSLFQEVTVQC